MRPFVLCSLLVLLRALPAPAQEGAPAAPFRPAPLDPRLAAPVPVAQQGTAAPAGEPDYTDQMLFGVGGGLVGAAAVGGTWALYLAAQDPAELNEFAWLGPILGALIAYPVGSAGGVYLASRRMAPGGSAAATLGGAALGWLAGGAGAGVTSGITYLLGPPAGAALGYNLSWRRSQRAPAAPPPEEGERPGPAQEGEGGAPF